LMVGELGKETQRDWPTRAVVGVERCSQVACSFISVYPIKFHRAESREISRVKPGIVL
jgi:hypothetical protein